MSYDIVNILPDLHFYLNNKFRKKCTTDISGSELLFIILIKYGNHVQMFCNPCLPLYKDRLPWTDFYTQIPMIS